jgi:hypothetical protein
MVYGANAQSKTSHKDKSPVQALTTNMDDAPNPEDVIMIAPLSNSKLTRLENQGTNAIDIRYNKTTTSKPVTSKNIRPLENPPIL